MCTLSEANLERKRVIEREREKGVRGMERKRGREREREKGERENAVSCRDARWMCQIYSVS